MRNRKWVLVVAVIGAVLVLGGYFSWRFTRADEKLKELLLARIRPFLAQESDIQKVELDLSSLHLRGVKLAPKDRSFTLEIEDVRLNYKLLNLIRFRLAPYKITHEVVLFRPTIRILKDTARKMGKPEEEWLDFPEVFRRIDQVKRITVVDAAFFVEDSLGQSIRLAHSMNGWLQSHPADSATVRLSGKVFQSRTSNATLEGKLNLLSGKLLWMHALLKESESGNELPFLLPEYIKMTSGKIQGEVTYTQQDQLTGFLEINDGSLALEKANLNFQQVYLRGDFEKTDLSIQGRVENFNGSPLNFSGKMEDIANPRLDLKVESTRFSIPSFFAEIAPDYQLSLYGRAYVAFTVKGPLNRPAVNGRFSSTNLKTYGVPFDHFNTVFGLYNNQLTLKGQGRGKEDMVLDIEGMVNFADPKRTTSLDLKLQGNMVHYLPLWVQRRLETCSSDLNVQLKGGLANIAGNADGQFSLSFKEGGTLQLRPSLRYEDQTLFVDIASNEVFHSEGTIWHPFQKDVNWSIGANGLESLFRMVFSEGLQRGLSDITFEGNYSGSPRDWEIHTQGFRMNQGERSIVFNGTLSPLKSQRKKSRLQLAATYYASEEDTLPISARGSLSEQSMDIDACSIGDFITLEAEIPFRLDEPLRGGVYLSSLELEQLHDLFPKTRLFFGQLKGEMQMSGTRLKPDLDLKLTLSEGNFHSVNNLEGVLEYRQEDGQLKDCLIGLTQDGVPIIQGSAGMTDSDTLMGDFYGKDINFGDLFLAATGKTQIKGQGSFEVIIAGTSDKPRIKGSIDVSNGYLGQYQFQHLTAELSDTFSVETGIREGMLSIRRGQIDRPDGLKLLFWGDIAHNRERGSDISVLAEGNILGLLHETDDFFKSAQGYGEMFLRWAGRQGEWVLGSGRIRLDGGYVEMAHYLNRIEDIKANAELQQGERLFQISEFSGNIDGERFMLTNSGWETNERTYAPLVFEDLGIHVGALQLRTEGRGIHVHLPGFMEKGDKGWLSFEGKRPGEPFMIAGPPEFPLIRGVVGLSNTRLTYPFLKVEMDSADPIIRFLSRVNWDILVRPNKDVHYIRDIETPMGNVFADLQVVDKHGGINLQGIIEEKDYQVWGNLVSTEGSLEALDHFFRPERITFDYQKGTTDPILAGRTFTTVIDSLGMPSTVWLTLASVDTETGEEKSGGPFKTIQFRFSTDNPNLARNEADLMAALGYSSYYMKDRAYDALGLQLENMFFRPLIRPIERGLRRHLGLDIVRFSSMFSRNIMQLQMGTGFGFDPMHLFRSARLTLGKYVTRGVFITYSGKIHNRFGYQLPTTGIGFRHAVALEYSIRPDLFLEMEYTYDSMLLSDRREDKRIWLRHIFPF